MDYLTNLANKQTIGIQRYRHNTCRRKKAFNSMLVCEHAEFLKVQLTQMGTQIVERDEVIIRSVTQQKCQDCAGQAFVYILRAPLIFGRIY